MMKKLSIVLIVVLSVITLALAGFMVFTITQNSPGGLFNMQFNNGFVTQGNPNIELVNSQTIPLDGINSIQALYASDDVTILKTEGDSIILEEYMNKSDDKLLAKITQDGSSVKIEHGNRNFFGIFVIFRSHIKLYVPASYSGALNVSTSSGDIDAQESLELSSLSLQSSSGTINLQSASCADGIVLSSTSGEINAGSLRSAHVGIGSTSGDVSANKLSGDSIACSTTSGDIYIDEAGARFIGCESTSGSIEIGKAEGDMQLSSISGDVEVSAGSGGGSFSTTSGEISVNLTQLSGDVAADAVSGDIGLALPANAAFNFDAGSTSGSIRTDFDDALNFNRRGNSANGRVGENPQYNVRLITTSGSISVYTHE